MDHKNIWKERNENINVNDQNIRNKTQAKGKKEYYKRSMDTAMQKRNRNQKSNFFESFVAFISQFISVDLRKYHTYDHSWWTPKMDPAWSLRESW